MIESNIVNWVDLGDSLQNLDVYGKRKTIHFFNFIRVLMTYKTFGVFYYILLKFLFFLQIMMLTLTNLSKENDSAIILLKYISTVIFVQEIVKDNKTYKIAILVNSILTVFIILCIIYIIFSIRIRKFYMNLPIYCLNFVNILITNYLIGPIVQISILSTNCKNNKHIYLDVDCYSDISHLLIFIASMINLVFFLIFSVLLSIYFNEIGSVNENKVSGRINCNYEIYMNISKISMFVFAYVLQNYFEDSEVMRLIMQLFVFLNSIAFTFYTYFSVLFYDNRMNIITLYGWSYVAWFSFVIMLKDLLNINDTSVFHIIGWIVISFVIFFIQHHKEEYLLTDFNIFEAKSLKEIELFNIKMFNLINIRSMKNKTMLLGLIEKFEGYFKSIPDLNEKYEKLCSDDVLKKKFNSSLDLPILSIVYLIYEYHLEKSNIKSDVLLVMVYFLMNKFKKVYLAISLCSKIKITSHKQSYLKFILMEEIKEYLVNKITKSNNKESIKHVQIGSVILYNIYTELFRIRIYDAACNQIDYFDILRNNTTNSKTTSHFLKIGKDILDIRKEILKLWQRILELNPFSDESERDYMLYLETIMQDDLLAKIESKKFTTLKNNKLSERTNVYHSMFRRDISSVLLVDGYSVLGRILYSSPNFPFLFNFSGKEILNLTIEDLMPSVISAFHKELIDNAVKYSNINKIFNGQKDMLLKGKSGGIYNIKLFVKCVPNFSFGLIYMVYITKIQEHNYIIVLDEEYKINALTDYISAGGTPYVMNSNYGLTNSIIGHNIAMVIPDILTQMEYKDGKFVIMKPDIDLKGNLYPAISSREIDNKVAAVYEKIKTSGRLSCDEDQKRETVAEFEELMKEITTKYNKPFSVFFRLATHTFLGGKYKYHRLYITNDLIALNENSHFYNSTKSLATQSENLNMGKEADGEVTGDIKGSKISSSGVGSKKIIKLRGIGFDSEKKELLQKAGETGAGDNPNTPKKDGNTLKKEEEKFQNESSSIYTKSSLDSSSFNKLKNCILDKKEVISIKIMKYLGIGYGLFIILFIYLSYIGGKNTFNEINDYLDENLFFNHTKISVSCIYLAATNLKWVKNEFINNETNCGLYSCDTFYNDLLKSCIIDTKKEKENSTFFYNDFKEILGETIELSLSIYQMDIKENFTIDMENLLTLIISTGLDFSYNVDSYFDSTQTETIFDVMNTNILEQTTKVIEDTNLVGFDRAKIEKNVSKNSSKLNMISLICAVIFFVLIVVSYCILVYQLYKMQINYLSKLIKLNSPNFEFYIKKLEELKKKLRNDGEGEEDEDNGMVNSELGLDKKLKGEESEKDKKKEEDKKKDKSKHKKDKEKDQSSTKKKKREKLTKMQMLKETKIKTMSKSFFIWNFFFILRGVGVFVIAISYFLVISIIQASYKNKFLEFDSNINSIEVVYKTTFDVFLRLKYILVDYTNYEIAKNNSSNTTHLAIEVPENNEIETPKLGNLLMPIINSGEYNKEQVDLLNTLYNADACSVLFEKDSDDYINCSSFWSSILVKGMEQSITQMSVVINTVLDELNALRLGSKNITVILNNTSSYSQFEYFIEYYFLLAYWKTVDIFDALKADKINSIFNIYLIILIVYIVAVFVLMTLVIKLVYSSRDMLNSFLNFIGILPIKYICEDPELYKDILKLEQKIY